MKIETMNCPSCGAGIKIKNRECDYCGSVLIITSAENLAASKIDIKLLNSSLEKWKEKLKINPLDPEVNYAIGLVYMNKNLKEAAIKHFNIVVEHLPEFALGHYNLALLLFDDGKVIIDSDDFRLAQKHIEYASMLDLVEANGFKWFFSALKLSDVDRNLSIHDYKKAIGACPDIPTFYNNLGYEYLEANNGDEAEKYLKKALELDNNFTMAYSNLCLLYINKSNYIEAEVYGKLAIESFKDFLPDAHKGKVYNNYSVSLWNLGKKEEAIDIIKLAVAFAPSESQYRANLEVYTKKSGCFIATAAMGDYNHPVVIDLRQFRDNWLLKRNWGIRFVEHYYNYGPRVASVIEHSNFMRRFVFLLIIQPLWKITRRIK